MKLNAKQVLFLKALLTSGTVKEAYEKAGIAEHTAYKYLSDDVANDKEQTGASRIRAVEVALSYAYKGMELEDLNNRLTEIERMLDDTK